MKKLLILCVALFIGAPFVSAQTPTFWGKDKVAGIAIGFGSNLYSGVFYTDVKTTPAILGQFELCIKDNLFNDKSSIGVGGIIGYSSAKISNVWKRSNFIIGGRGVFHYALVDKLDTYAGLMLGYNIVKYKWEGGLEVNNTSSSGVVHSEFIGARYYFTDNFAAFGELGYGYTFLNLGVALKF